MKIVGLERMREWDERRLKRAQEALHRLNRFNIRQVLRLKKKPVKKHSKKKPVKKHSRK
jgi:hypothetical protein